MLIGAENVHALRPDEIINSLRKISSKTRVQIVDAKSVYGQKHIIEVLKITLEAEKRGVLCAKDVLTDLLLRVACTNQITTALKKVGFKNNTEDVCFILFSKDKDQVLKVGDHVLKSFTVNDSVIDKTSIKKEFICANIGLGNTKLFEKKDDTKFLGLLIERAVMVTK
jgi:tRNA threonylcarbamoyladenosine modification (KEOPS) complex Cgi121 subunit